MELAKAYSHQDVERRWYSHWVKSGLFEPAQGNQPYFSMVIPPPNVTGSLHMGHALNNTLQDVLCRYRRMDGYRVLWVPGTDHAGIATQNVVERRLASEGLTRAHIGRRRFVEKVWEWKQEAGNAILHQLKSLGVSCDWAHERFTMDEGLSHAVREAFVLLWEDHLLYRAQRLINWCPRCKTALADIEVVHEESDGHLWYIRYPLADDPSQALVVATTRPETMLGDTAVAVHPDDRRYQAFLGKRVRLPITDRIVPLIFDSFVDQNFGTGALKITPGHDFNDFDIGERFGLEKISIFDADARVDASSFLARGESEAWVERYRNRDRFEARKLIVAELKERGLLEKVEPHRLAVGHCYRCQTIIEPYLTPQWFVNIKPLAEPAIQVVREGRIRIIPEGWGNAYFAWMENIKDWCISRQIWWGHQIPAWYCRSCDHANIVESESGDYLITKDASPLVGRDAPTACPKCYGGDLVQDPDVLDTWFSSGLWPFSTLGWPEKTDDLGKFYPTSALVTGFDILFFWVARMIMMGLKFMGDVPFRDVYIHALVRDEQGQKMSKSKGNVIDPLDVMGTYGTDAFRFTLASMAAMGRDIKLSQERIVGYQNFVNKLWNAARFVLMNVSEKVLQEAEPSDLGEDPSLANEWILARLDSTINEARKALDAYRFNDYANGLYRFTWHEFCDWYVEFSKHLLSGKAGNDPVRTQHVLLKVLKDTLRLLHPVMPFVTEEIWQNLVGGRGSLMVEPYPIAKKDPNVPNPRLSEMEFLIEVIRAIRNLRAEMNCPPGKDVKVIFYGRDGDLTFLRSQEPYLRLLARVGESAYWTSGDRPKGAATAMVGSAEIYLPLGDLINLDEECARLIKEINKIKEDLSRVQKKLSNRDFLTKAKEEVVEKEREKAAQCEEKIRTLNRSLKRLEEVQAGRS